MRNRPITSTNPYTVVILSTLGLIVLLGIGGTAIYLTGLPLTSPVPLVFAPIAALLIIWASRTGRWGRLGFVRPGSRRIDLPLGRQSDLVRSHDGAAAHPSGGGWARWVPVLLPALVVLLLVLATAGGATRQSAAAWLGLVGFVLLVAFVEETLFRSVFLSLLAPKGRVAAVVVSTAAFALAHAINLLGGQDLSSTIGQIVFAVAFGVFAACCYLRTGSIWPALAFHALFDLAQLGSRTQTPPLVDAVMTGILLAGAVWLWAGIRADDRAVARPLTDAQDPDLPAADLTPDGVGVARPVGATGTAGRRGALGGR